MATIEKKSETVVQESFVLTYARSELEELLADPKPWLRQLRAALSLESTSRVKARRNGHRGGKVKRATKSRAGGFECQHCHKPFKRAGNRDRHESKCEVEIGTYKPATD